MSQLVLHPVNSELLIPEKQIIKTLIDCQFIQQNKIDNKYLVGENFLTLLTFMGCAPNIQIEFDAQDPNKAFCSVKVKNNIEPLFCFSENMRPPKCPKCKKGINNWVQYKNNQAFPCPHCQTPIQMASLNWKQQAGFSKTMIIIDNIYPQEAQPTPALINKLKETIQSDWQHFYLNQALDKPVPI